MPRKTLLSQTTIGSAGTTTGESVSIANANYVTVQSIFLYGAGGTAVKVYLQTSLDAGTTWFDIASHAFTTAAGVKVSSVTGMIAPASQAFTPAEVTLTDNTIIQGVVGDRVRVKVVSTGTYSGATSIAVKAVVK